MNHCKYGKKVVFCFDLYNEYRQPEYSKINELKQASSRGALVCLECGSQVILKAGSERIIHFAHKQLSTECSFSFAPERFPHRKAKFVLYKHLASLPEVENVECDVKHSSSIRSDLIVTHPSGSFAVEIEQSNISYTAWAAKAEAYDRIGIVVEWVLLSMDLTKQSTPYVMKAIMHKNKTVTLLDVDKEQIVLCRLVSTVDKKGRLMNEEVFRKNYSVQDISTAAQGFSVKDFENEFMAFEKNSATKKDRALEREKELARFFSVTHNVSAPKSKVYVQLPATKDTRREESAYKKRKHKQKFDYLTPSKKSNLDQLRLEALKQKSANPQGPWYDSTRDDKWGDCKHCGEFTKDWVDFWGESNKCVCRKCSRQP